MVNLKRLLLAGGLGLVALAGVWVASYALIAHPPRASRPAVRTAPATYIPPPQVKCKSDSRRSGLDAWAWDIHGMSYKQWCKRSQVNPNPPDNAPRAETTSTVPAGQTTSSGLSPDQAEKANAQSAAKTSSACNPDFSYEFALRPREWYRTDEDTWVRGDGKEMIKGGGPRFLKAAKGMDYAMQRWEWEKKHGRSATAPAVPQPRR